MEQWLKGRKDAADWKTVWVSDAQRHPWPVLVRTGGVSARGESGIQDNQYTEVLEWDTDLKPQPDPKARESFPQVIISAPKPSDRSMFSGLKIKI
jgi:hypothetical protein